MAEEEDDETLIAAKMPGYPVAHHGGAHDDDALPDEDATLLAIPRGAVAHAAHAARAAAGGAPAYVPPAFPAMRPAAGLPAAPHGQPVRPAAGYPAQRPAAGFPPPPPPPVRPGSTRPPATPPPPPPRQAAQPVTSTLPLPSFGHADSVTIPNQQQPPVPNAARAGAALGALPAPSPQSVYVPPGMPQPRAGLPPPPPPSNPVAMGESRPAMIAPTQQSAVAMGEPRPSAHPSQPPQASAFAPSTVVMGGPPQASPTYAAAAHLPPPPAPPAPSYDQAIAPPPAQGLPSIVVRVLLGCGVVTVLGLLTLIYLEL